MIYFCRYQSFLCCILMFICKSPTDTDSDIKFSLFDLRLYIFVLLRTLLNALNIVMLCYIISTCLHVPLQVRVDRPYLPGIRQYFALHLQLQPSFAPALSMSFSLA
ncbi:uncharacterized protein LY89DRAFT_311773 [Mollisia scopiformis]|uniref:Uncharacterized protein n=1 Tax=Mollisia scopiformis TaxID=149040 RepID=A0A194XRM3_MOLSC|nr:uncharacterized protein LY89DRAFT_311773 [Mollisia scopiformis]KUJ22843.1 hypothetical protein LY89DRAFT_311773 [Mollisia scopiformis]